jgi:hypothetical protein
VRPEERSSRPDPEEVVLERASVAAGRRIPREAPSVPVRVKPPFEVAEET